MQLINLAGRKFGWLRVLEFAGTNERGALWRCRCKCGKKVTVRSYSLRSGNTRSCGCLAKNNAVFKHGHNKRNATTKTYRCWQGMLTRCRNPNAKGYANYGGRGIKVCPRWQGENGFQNFLEDLGPRPDGKWLERGEVDGNYEPDNCRWATRSEQAQNRRKRLYRATSRFQGVSRIKRRFVSRITVDGNTFNLGSFKSETASARAYNKAAKRFYGEHARLNELSQAA